VEYTHEILNKIKYLQLILKVIISKCSVMAQQNKEWLSLSIYNLSNNMKKIDQKHQNFKDKSLLNLKTYFYLHHHKFHSQDFFE